MGNVIFYHNFPDRNRRKLNGVQSGHFTPRGNAEMAKIIAEGLKEKGLLKRVAPAG
jgi:hypothetical protein